MQSEVVYFKFIFYTHILKCSNLIWRIIQLMYFLYYTCDAYTQVKYTY